MSMPAPMPAPLPPKLDLSPEAIANHAQKRPDAAQEAIEQFNKFMQKVPEAHESYLGGQSSVASQMLSSQENMMHKMFADVREFSAQAPHMDYNTMMARHVELQYEMAAAQMSFNAGVYVAQSGKSGLQTLMKNQ